jgi:hypothetical protein
MLCRSVGSMGIAIGDNSGRFLFPTTHCSSNISRHMLLFRFGSLLRLRLGLWFGGPGFSQY